MKQLMKSIYILLILTATYFNTSAQVRDIDNNVYPTCQIGNQKWMSKNLSVSKFTNGDPIPQAHSYDEWRSYCLDHKPVWAYYDFNSTDQYGFGKLYNVFALEDPRGLAPRGWSIPHPSDIDELKKMLHCENNEINCLKTMKSTTGWLTQYTNSGEVTWTSGNGTNSTGLNIIPAGNIDYRGSVNKGFECSIWVRFWMSTEYHNVIFFSSPTIKVLGVQGLHQNNAGAYVRCVEGLDL